VCADDHLTQAADFDCPRVKRLKSLHRAGVTTNGVGQRKSAAWVKSVSAPTDVQSVPRLNAASLHANGENTATKEDAIDNRCLTSWEVPVAGFRVNPECRSA
jgi:hypothetical protein